MPVPQIQGKLQSLGLQAKRAPKQRPAEPGGYQNGKVKHSASGQKPRDSIIDYARDVLRLCGVSERGVEQERHGHHGAGGQRRLKKWHRQQIRGKKGVASVSKGSNEEGHSALVKAALEELAIRGHFAWGNRAETPRFIEGRFIPFGKKGSADILIVLPGGRHGEAEAKTGEAEQRKEQKIHQRMVEKNGGLYVVFRSVKDLFDQLSQHGY